MWKRLYAIKIYLAHRCLKGGVRIIKESEMLYYIIGFLIFLFAVFYIGGVNNGLDIKAIVLVYFFTVGAVLLSLGVFIERPVERKLIYMGEAAMGITIILSGAFGYVSLPYVFGGILALIGGAVMSYGYYSKKTYD